MRVDGNRLMREKPVGKPSALQNKKNQAGKSPTRRKTGNSLSEFTGKNSLGSPQKIKKRSGNFPGRLGD